MKAIILKNLEYPYTKSLKKGDIVEIREHKEGDVLRDKEGRIIDKKHISFVPEINVISLYKNFISILDNVNVSTEQKSYIKEEIKKLYHNFKLDID